MSKPTEVTAIWPDGTEQVVSIYCVHGMKRKMPGGKIVRPVFRYDFDLEAVEPPSVRENLRRDLRKIGAFPKGHTVLPASAAEGEVVPLPAFDWPKPDSTFLGWKIEVGKIEGFPVKETPWFLGPPVTIADIVNDDFETPSVLPLPDDPTKGIRVRRPVLYSRRCEIAEAAEQWLASVNAPALPVNIIAALDALGFLNPSGMDAESGSNAPPVACPASPEEACPHESSGPA